MLTNIRVWQIDKNSTSRVKDLEKIIEEKLPKGEAVDIVWAGPIEVKVVPSTQFNPELAIKLLSQMGLSVINTQQLDQLQKIASQQITGLKI